MSDSSDPTTQTASAGSTDASASDSESAGSDTGDDSTSGASTADSTGTTVGGDIYPVVYVGTGQAHYQVTAQWGDMNTVECSGIRTLRITLYEDGTMEAEADGAEVGGDASGLDYCALTSDFHDVDITNHGDGTATVAHCDDWAVTFDETGMTAPDCMRVYAPMVTEGVVDIIYTLTDVEFYIE